MCTCIGETMTHSSLVSLGMPLGRECSPLLLQRTTPSEHVQTSGQPDAGRQPLSSAPGEKKKTEKERDIRDGKKMDKTGLKVKDHQFEMWTKKPPQKRT